MRECLCVCLFVRSCVGVFVHVPVYVSCVRLFACVFVCVPGCLFMRLCACLLASLRGRSFVCLVVCAFACLCV